MADIVYVALGSNLGNRAAFLASARSALDLTSGVRVLAASSVEETAPLGGAAQGPYLNQMIAIETELAPDVLLQQLQRIERALGRIRTTRWSARTIDLDIVDFGGRVLATPALTLPHPGLRDRDFWQREVAELDTLLRRAA
ncbi:MAG: 2-amino-4-hydroxy-6-hydroxymethyldihydropteridine diphosphokinase [bacterium]